MNILTILSCISLSISLLTAIESEIQKINAEVQSKNIIHTVGKNHCKNKYTKIQEGRSWCFYSCMQGLLKSNGFSRIIYLCLKTL